MKKRYPECDVVRLTPSPRIPASPRLYGLMISQDVDRDAVRGQHELHGKLLTAGNADCTRAPDFSGRSSGFEFIETIYAIGSGGIRPSAITPNLPGRSCHL